MRAQILFLAAMSFALAQGQTNYAVNNSFETVDPQNGNLAANWQAYGNPYTRLQDSLAWDQHYDVALTANQGAVQHIVLNQSAAQPIRISVRMKGQNIDNNSTDTIGASLGCKITFVDGASAWCPQTAITKSVGTFDWKWVGYNSASISSDNSPIVSVDVRLIMGNVGGSAWFDSVRVEPWPVSQSGIVTFRFDDSFLSTYTTAYPILASYGFSGASAAVTSYLGADSMHMTVAHLQDLVAHGWSVLSHTVDHPNLTTLDLVHLNDELYWSHKFLIDNGFAVSHFALPFGAYNANVITRAQAERYNGYAYKSVTSSDDGINPKGVFPYNVMVEPIESNTTMNEVQAWIATAADKKGWLVLLIHEIDNPNGVYTVSSQMFRQIVSAVAQSGLPVMNYDAAFTQMTTP